MSTAPDNIHNSMLENLLDTTLQFSLLVTEIAWNVQDYISLTH